MHKECHPMFSDTRIRGMSTNTSITATSMTPRTELDTRSQIIDAAQSVALSRPPTVATAGAIRKDSQKLRIDQFFPIVKTTRPDTSLVRCSPLLSLFPCVLDTVESAVSDSNLEVINLSTYPLNTTEIELLQLGAIVTSTFFKATDRNGFICSKSCHHPAWLRSVLVSQFLHLRRNCTRSENFVRETSALKLKFFEEGYSEVQLKQAIDRATKNREELLVPREVIPNDSYKHAFFTTFSTQ